MATFFMSQCQDRYAVLKFMNDDVTGTLKYALENL